tara:strand:+ start:239 stop:412 length:174 start_codon:yes stop_codon:yes gene_type:complete
MYVVRIPLFIERLLMPSFIGSSPHSGGSPVEYAAFNLTYLMTPEPELFLTKIAHVIE